MAESTDIELEGSEDLLNRKDISALAGNMKAESTDIDLERILDEGWLNRLEPDIFSDISAGNIRAECTDTDFYSIVDWVNRLEAGNIKAECTDMDLDSFVDLVNCWEADISSDISAGNIFTPVVARKRDFKGFPIQYSSLNQQAEISSNGALLNEPVNNDAAHARVGTRQGQLQPAKLTAANIYRDNAPSVVFISNNCRQDVFSFEERGYGSGFFWDDKGHIVTNYHVIHGADILRVTLGDQSVYEAKVIGSDPNKDVAVLRIFAPKKILRPVPVGSSRGLVVGQKVYAIGNPFRLLWTFTTGRIGFLDRLITSATTGYPIQVIQTDAAINHGSSGGPLFDSSGFLIGINTSIYSPSGTSVGVSFSIPVDTVSGIIDRWVNMEKSGDPYLASVQHQINQWRN